jgi:hypothetical protein
MSGSGDASDERNDYILGQRNIDSTLTSEERRLYALSNNAIPHQPVNSIVSVVGSNSGVFLERITDDLGVTYGNYELMLDNNPETGGSPFGLDRLRWISSVKEVESETLVKGVSSGIEQLSFNDVINISSVYTDVKISSENSLVSSADRGVIVLMHKPAKTVTRIKNETTGELYSVSSQNKSLDTGLNEEGLVTISGRSLPSASDTLSVDYTWRHEYDGFIDYNGTNTRNNYILRTPASDSIDWGVAGRIYSEESYIEKTDDGASYILPTAHDINRVSSVYFKTELELEVVTASIGDASFNAIEIPPSEDEAMNIMSVKSSYGVEGYNTKRADGTFSSRTIYLPTDGTIEHGDTATVSYNKVELFDIESGDGSFYNNRVVLPSEGNLDGADVLDIVNHAYSSDSPVFVDYVKSLEPVLSETDFSSLPVRGIFSSAMLTDASLSAVNGSFQPVSFYYEDSDTTSGIEIFSPTNLAVSTSNTYKSGKIKIAGTTMSRLSVDVYAGLSFEDLTFNLESEIETYMVGCNIAKIGIARVDYVAKLDSNDNPDDEYDIIGYSINNNIYDYGVCSADSSLGSKRFSVPSTPRNLAIPLSSGDKLRVSILVYNEAAVEELYFPGDNMVVSKERFSRIDLVAVTSGFRSASGSLSGTVSIDSFNQPSSNDRYNTDYNFTAPKEGERITISYNTNVVMSNATMAVERVRPITADVLVKEAQELKVNVYGTVVINDNSLNNSNTIVENVSNAVVGLMTSGSLGDVVDLSDITSVVSSTDGVDSVDIYLFNEDGETGRRSFVRALDNQTISAGTVSFEAVSRQNFRIT